MLWAESIKVWPAELALTERLELNCVGDECRTTVKTDEYAQDSDPACSWKRHHILGVALTQADIIKWKSQ